jgi:hypothetical protein
MPAVCEGAAPRADAWWKIDPSASTSDPHWHFDRDPANLGDLDRLFAQIKREKDKLDIVFAKAGVAKYAPLGTIMEEFSELDLRHQYEGPSLQDTEGGSTDAAWRHDHIECVGRG